MYVLDKYKQKHKFYTLTIVIMFSLVLYLTSINLLSVGGGKFVLRTDVETSDQNTINENDESEQAKYTYQSFHDIQKSASNVFFIETRCSTNKSAQIFQDSGEAVLTARQSCAIESTARTNPDRKIYVLLSCLAEDIPSPFLWELAALPGVTLARLEPDVILKDTPAQQLGDMGCLESSSYPVEHSSDIIRLALLWKYGGTYSDLDVVTIRSLEPLGTDWVGMQDSVTIANGVINISPSGTGHDLMGRALERVAQHYDPGAWSANGPGLITPLILDECGVTEVATAVGVCQNFTVFNSSVLYPIFYPSWGVLFDASQGLKLVDELEKSSYSIHMWNKMSHGTTLETNSSSAYALLARKYCPSTVANIEVF